MYFSDHGLTHSHDGTFLRHAGTPDSLGDAKRDFKESYAVPMLKISSDDKERKIIKTKKTGFNFIYGFTEWLGIKEKHLDPNYCFWCDKEDEYIKVLVYRRGVLAKDDGFAYRKEIPISELADDPAKLPK